MTAQVEFFFDCSSPWTYLGLEALVKAADVHLLSCQLPMKSMKSACAASRAVPVLSVPITCEGLVKLSGLPNAR